jgi:hypothetical protein
MKTIYIPNSCRFYQLNFLLFVALRSRYKYLHGRSPGIIYSDLPTTATQQERPHVRTIIIAVESLPVYDM